MPITERLSAKLLLNAATETQETYLGDYITATTNITGLNRDQTATIFTTSAGQFIPPSNIILNPQNPIQENITLKAGRQELFINEIILTPPNPTQEGYVSLDCWFTDIYGVGQRIYIGNIAHWNEENPPICKR